MNGSMIFDACRRALEADVHRVCRNHDPHELVLERSLGRGGWGAVNERRSVHDRSHEPVPHSCHDHHGRDGSCRYDRLRQLRRRRRWRHREAVGFRLLLVSCVLLLQPCLPQSAIGLRSEECFEGGTRDCLPSPVLIQASWPRAALSGRLVGSPEHSSRGSTAPCKMVPCPCRENRSAGSEGI